jgi:putative oxidoreductase
MKLFAETGSLMTLGPVTIILALLFLFAGGAKLIGNSAMVEEFARIGIGQWFRHFTGALEVGAAIGILMPAVRFWAALLIAGVMAGATIANLVILHLPSTAGLTFTLMAIALSLAWQWRTSLLRW